MAFEKGKWKREIRSGLLRLAPTGAYEVATAGEDYYAPGSVPVAVVDGGTGATTADAARANLGIAGGGGALIPDPDNPGLLMSITGFIPDPDNPGLLIGV